MSNKSSDLGFVAGVVAGSGLMYMMDPDKCGRRRRVLVRDKDIRAEHVAGRFADKTVRDMQNRVRGVAAEAWATFREKEVPDEVLVQRVHSRIGRVVSHPHAITVTAQNGIVTLSGPILEHEVEDLLDAVFSVRGVRDVVNNLEAHKTRNGVPDLQGGSQRPGIKPDVLQETWAPATRTLVGLGGVGLWSLSRRNRTLRLPLEITGSVLLFRAVTNMSLRRALGLSRTPRVIILQKSVNINAPVEELYQLFSNPENFPRIFEHVMDVRHSRDNLYHWTVAGPAGISVSWEFNDHGQLPNQVIAWRSVPDAAVKNAGFIKFQQNPNGGTTLHIQFTYNPPAGVIGHVIAWLFGADPKHELDDDMARLKSLFENGKTTVHHHKLTKEQVERELACN